MKSVFKSLVGNTLIFAIGNSVSIILAFIMVPFYTQVLSTSDFGISDIITTTTAMLVPLVSLNVFSAVFRFSLDDNNNIEIFTNGVIISTVGAALSLIIASILEISGLTYSLLVGIYLAATLFLNLFQNFTRGINHVKSFTLSGVIATVVNIVSNLLLMWAFKMGLNGYLYSLIISTVVTSLYLFFDNQLYSYIRFSDKSWTGAKELLKYSIPMIPNSFAWWLTNDANKLIVLLFLGPSSNGLLAVANKIPSMINTVFNMFSNAWQMTAVNENGKQSTNKIYTIIFNSISGLMLIGAAIIVLCIQWFMGFYVSDKFYLAWRLVPILVLTSVFSNISGFLGTTYLVVKQTKGLITTTLWGMLINILLSLLLVPIIGLNGAGLSGAIGFLAVSLLRLHQTQQFIKFEINFKFLTILLCGYVLTSGFIYMNQHLVAIGIVVIMSIYYSIITYHSISKELYLISTKN